MNAITDVWRQLVRRRLWPVALILVAALAAVPMLLAKEPEATPATAPAPVPAGGAAAKASLATEPIVALAGPEDEDADRRPLGKRHDIFKPTKKPVKAKATKDDESAAKADDAPSGDTDKSGGSGGATTPAPTQPADVPRPPKTYPLYSLKVRFSVDDDGVTGYLPRNTALPSTAEPMIIYLGLEDDHKTAVFLLDSTVQAVGDGDCDPTPENCETVRMRVGDTMFFDVIGEDGTASGSQFQLDLLKINTKQTTNAAKAAKSAKLAKVSSASKIRGSLTTGFGRESLRRLGVVTRNG